MAVSRLFQQTRFHLRQKPEATFKEDVIQKSCLTAAERKSLIESEELSWKEQQQLQRALKISLKSPIQKKVTKKTIEAKNKSSRSTTKARRKFAYPETRVASPIFVSDVPNVTKNIIFAEDFIDYLCFRPSERSNKMKGWKVFHQFWECNQKQLKTENDSNDYFSIADLTNHSGDYYEKPINSSMSFDISLENDSSDCMSEESLEPADISSYFV